MLSVSSKPIKKLMFAISHMLSASSYQIWKLVSPLSNYPIKEQVFPFSYMLSVSSYPIRKLAFPISIMHSVTS